MTSFMVEYWQCNVRHSPRKRTDLIHCQHPVMYIERCFISIPVIFNTPVHCAMIPRGPKPEPLGTRTFYDWVLEKTL